MTFGGGTGGKMMARLKEEHRRYLETFKLINKGSLEGATPFTTYYIYKTYITKYSDHRAFILGNYR